MQRWRREEEGGNVRAGSVMTTLGPHAHANAHVLRGAVPHPSAEAVALTGGAASERVCLHTSAETLSNGKMRAAHMREAVDGHDELDEDALTPGASSPNGRLLGRGQGWQQDMWGGGREIRREGWGGSVVRQDVVGKPLYLDTEPCLMACEDHPHMTSLAFVLQERDKRCVDYYYFVYFCLFFCLFFFRLCCKSVTSGVLIICVFVCVLLSVCLCVFFSVLMC